MINKIKVLLISPFYPSPEYANGVNKINYNLLNDNDIYTTTEYGGNEFCSSILKENIFACQFHPEKSGENGLRILNEMFN